jgi:hypothetical protein
MSYIALHSDEQDAIEFIESLRRYGRGDACRRLKVILLAAQVAFLNAYG